MSRIQRLDPERDCDEICNLSSLYEFPWDSAQALALAMLRTYGVPTISAVIAGTAEFERRTAKRILDTRLLLHEIFQGLSTERGRAAVHHLNRIHAAYAISNGDYLYTLTAFVVTPKRWLDRYGWRPLSGHEIRASVTRFRRLGQMMGIEDVPESYQEFERFLDDYERRHFRLTESNRRLAAAMLRARQSAAPQPLRPFIRPISLAVLDEDLLAALGLPRPPRPLRILVDQALKLRARVIRRLPPRPDSNPAIPAAVKSATRAHPGGYAVTDLGPDHARHSPHSE